MTREEAIEVINDVMTDAVYQILSEEKEALEMAIKALSQEPCEDAISREAVIKAVDAHTNEDGTLDDDISVILEDLPTVTQKPKYWIDKDNKLYKMPDDIPTMTIQYPTITHGDTISRTEVMNVISDFVALEKYIDKHNHITFEPLEKMINALPSVTHKLGKCKNCKYFEYDSVAKVDGIPLIVAHEICNKWGNGCKTSEDGYCYLFEPQESEDKE